MIGGTVAGFINNYGCFTRGATALAVYSKDMDVAVGYGENTKRAPHLAAKKCAEMIRRGLEGSKYKNKFLLSFISACKVPEIAGKRRKVVKNYLATITLLFSSIFFYLLQKGPGREDEILEDLVKNFSDYKMISGSLMDDLRMLESYQFFNDKVLMDSIVALGISTNLNGDVRTTRGLHKTTIKFRVTKLSRDQRIIHEINNKPAVKGFLELLNWPETYFDENMYKRVFYYPLAFESDNGTVPLIIGAILGNSIGVSYKIKNPELCVLTTTGKDILNTVRESVNAFSDKNIRLGIISSCAIRLETLGMNVYKIREVLLNFFKKKPFIVIYVGGESTYSQEKGWKYGNFTFNTLIMYD